MAKSILIINEDEEEIKELQNFKRPGTLLRRTGEILHRDDRKARRLHQSGIKNRQVSIEACRFLLITYSLFTFH
ncbi:MAG: hypothetical protein IJF76_01405 [Clostridia bacterium]|nr:hypothetical protein [Clostridia bacterium]